jgi:hypothetical protein
MIYACPLSHLVICCKYTYNETSAPQNKILRTIGKFPKSTPIRDMHMAFRIPYMDDYIIKLYRQQAQAIQNRENTHVRNTGQGEVRRRQYKRFKHGGGQVYDRSSD